MRTLLFILALICVLPPANAQRARRLSAPAWTPAGLPGLVVWVNERGLSSGPLARWPNQGTAGASADFIGAVNSPTVSTTLNGRNVVTFDGVNDYMTNAFASFSNDATIFAVFRANSMGDSTFIFDGINAVHRFAFYRDNTTRKFDFYTTQNVYLVDTNSNWNTVMLYDSMSESSTYRYNALAESLFPSSPGVFTLEGITLGSRYSLNAPYFGNTDIAELLIFNRALTTVEKSAVMGYLRGKWGI